MKVIVRVGMSTGNEEVDQGQGGGKNVRSLVTVCVTKAPLLLEVMFCGFGLFLNVIGCSEILGNRVVEAWVTSVAVMFQFHHGMTLAVMVGIEKVVVCTVRATVFVTVGCPEMVTVFVVVQATSMGVTKGSIENVVGEANVDGATMMLTGAMAVAVLDSESTTDPST